MLRQTPRDSATFSFLRALTGLGVSQPGSEEQMLALEATQLAQEWNDPEKPNPLETAVADPDMPPESIPLKARRDYMEVLLEHPRASKRLKGHIKQTLGKMAKPPTPKAGKKAKPEAIKAAAVAEAKTESEVKADPPSFAPPFRCLRGYAIDPSLSTKLETATVSEVVFKVPWEDLKPGPVLRFCQRQNKISNRPLQWSRALSSAEIYLRRLRRGISYG